MNKILKIFLVLTAAGLYLTAGGQPYDRIERRNFWNAGKNVNGLRTDSVSISYAQLRGSYAAGGLRDTYMAPEGWRAEAVAKTILHLNKFSMNGAFSFENFSGKEMCGSMSGRPGYYPVDVLEFTPGKKTRQTYHFDGGITADIGGNWRIGGKIGFTSENYTKRKDLRHTDYLLGMTVVPGIMFHDGDFAAGACYIFGKSSETITAEVLGISSGSYYAFLDKGLMYGVYDIWDSQGTHLSETGVSGFPAREISHGAAVQVQWKDLYAEAEYLRSSGDMGEKQSIWYRFPTDAVTARIGYVAGDGDTRHYIRMEAAWKDRSNFESVMESNTEDGVTITTVYGQNRILRQRDLRLAPEYEITAPGWEFRAGAEFGFLQEQASQIYPYLFYRETFTGEGFVSGMVKAGRFDIRGRLSFRQGTSSESGGIADTEIPLPDRPARLEDWNGMHMEYLTAPRTSAGLSLRFNFRKGLYAEISGEYTRGFRLEFLPGADRWGTAAMIGCTF